MRVLFFNEGNAGGIMLGHERVESVLRSGLSDGDLIDPHFATLTGLSGVALAAATRRIPVLTRSGLDLPTLRWHVVQSLRARRELAAQLAVWPADAACVQTQSVALAMGAVARRKPLLLSIDATVEQWWSMPHRGALGRRGERTVAPSRWLERRIFRRAAVVLAWTEWALRGVRATCPQATAVHHHPGLDIDRFVPDPSARSGKPRVLFVGARFEAKGGDDLFAALADLAGDELELDIVTPEWTLDAPGVTVHRLASGDPQLVRLYQQADLLVLPTWGDTNPWVILEAMACGTPVIASDIGAIPELLDGERAGLLVRPGDRGAIRESVLALLRDPARRAAMGKIGRELCETRYDSRVQVARLGERIAEAAARFTR